MNICRNAENLGQTRLDISTRTNPNRVLCCYLDDNLECLKVMQTIQQRCNGVKPIPTTATTTATSMSTNKENCNQYEATSTAMDISPAPTYNNSMNKLSSPNISKVERRILSPMVIGNSPPSNKQPARRAVKSLFTADKESNSMESPLKKTKFKCEIKPLLTQQPSCSCPLICTCDTHTAATTTDQSLSQTTMSDSSISTLKSNATSALFNNLKFHAAPQMTQSTIQSTTNDSTPTNNIVQNLPVAKSETTTATTSSAHLKKYQVLSYICNN
jgi:hypothetical protein